MRVVLAMVFLFGVYAATSVEAATDMHGEPDITTMCRTRRGMYHPYPGDASRYIQCNKQHRGFVRKCHPGTVWSHTSQTCIMQRRQTSGNSHHQEAAERKQTPTQSQFMHAYQPKQDKRAVNAYRDTSYVSPLAFIHLLNKNGELSFASDAHSSVRMSNPSGRSSYYSFRMPSSYSYKYKLAPRSSPSSLGSKLLSSSFRNSQSQKSSSSSAKAQHQSTSMSMKADLPVVSSYKQPEARSLYQSMPLRSDTRATHWQYSYGSQPRTSYSTSYQYGGTRHAQSQQSSSYGSRAQSSYSVQHKGVPQNGMNQATNSYGTNHGTGGYGAGYETGGYGTAHATGGYGSADTTGGYGNARQYVQGPMGTLKSTGYVMLPKSTYQSTHLQMAPRSSTNTKSTKTANAHLHRPQHSYTLFYGKRSGDVKNTVNSNMAHGMRNTKYDHYSTTKGTGNAYPSMHLHHGQPKATGSHYSGPKGSQAAQVLPLNNLKASGLSRSVHHHPVGKSAAKPQHQHQANSQQTSRQEQALSTRCHERNVRYFEDPVSRSHYYECQPNFRLVHHTCNVGTIWVQPLRMCMDVQNQKNTHVPMANPCAATDDFFKPYPSDPTKYIECRSWSSIFIWTCHPNQVWAQERQQCVDHMKPPVIIQPKALPPSVVHLESQPRVNQQSGKCGDGTTFYMPYLPDNTKFIQCDEHDKEHIMPCPSGNVWDNRIKNCVNNKGEELDRTIAFEYDFSNARPLTIEDYQGNFDDMQIYEDNMVYENYQNPDIRSSGKSFRTGQSYGHQHRRANRCKPTELWVPSLEQCVSLENTTQNSEMCHAGDLYFHNHHICAAVRTTHVEGKSLGSGYVYTYTDYNSYTGDSGHDSYDTFSTDTGKALPSNKETKAVYDPCSPYNSEYAAENPCQSLEDTFYYNFTMDMRCYIQCDQAGMMTIKPCGECTYWKQEAMTCVKDYLHQKCIAENDVPMSSMRDSAKSLYPGGGNEDPNVVQQDMSHLCNEEEGFAYRDHPGKPDMFIMCTDHTVYRMHCPHGMVWNQDISVCYWPPTEAELQEVVEVQGNFGFK